MKRARVILVLLAVTLAAASTVSGCGCGRAPGTDEARSKVTKREVEKSDGPTSRPAHEQLLYDYFGAINDGRYKDAYGMWAPTRRPTSYAEFAASYREHVKTVRVRSLKRLAEFSSPGNEVFQVDLDATYVQEYPAGTGRIPEFWTVVQGLLEPDTWQIAAEGTGP